jgi:beta-galactosidase
MIWRSTWILCIPGMLLIANSCFAAPNRTNVDFDADWRFSRGDFPSAMMSVYDDSAWRQVNLPHDWSVEGPFEASLGSATGFAPGGIGWYRKHFKLDPAHKGKLISIEFDGIYKHSQVWINGQFVGGRPYGYSSFECDLTPYLKFGDEKKGQNVIAVRVDHTEVPDSRWYTGSGIYRHVRLNITEKLRIARWGSYISTSQVKDNVANLRIETVIENNLNDKKGVSLQLDIISPSGRVVNSWTTSGRVDADSKRTLVQQITISPPQLWSPESPSLYTLNSRLSTELKPIDETKTTFGIRTISFNPDKGFFLNGQAMKIKGVCLHHDAGSLGAAVPEKVLERRLMLLKELGVNAIRTSHNPPAPDLLDLCDRLGLMVQDEALDEFTPGKNKWITGWNDGVPSKFGYNEVFDEWSVADVQDMVLRDRNHPSIIMWSIGNEIDYANDPFSHPVLGEDYKPENPSAQKMVKCAKPLIDIVKKLDSRPITAALANVPMSDAVGFGELLDIVGYNYQEQRYAEDHKKYPKRFIYGSENKHFYKDWLAVRDNEYISGQFLWTGIDYLGEAGRWPSRAAPFGLLDLCGYKKPLAWFRQSLWSDKPMVYLCCVTQTTESRRRAIEEHWNWSKDKPVMVLCYTNCDEVRLMLNDKSIGTKKSSEAVEGVLTWQVPYVPGTLKAVGLKDGKTECEFSLNTAGKPVKIALSPDVTDLQADGKDICHLGFQIVDAKGVRVPDAANELKFEITGPAAIIGIDNGDVNDTSNCKDLIHKAYRGRGLAIIQSKTTTGKITVKVTSPGLESATAALTGKMVQPEGE